MIDLKTKYMGIELKNPIIVGASNLTANLDTIKKIEQYGAGAIVIKSLFEEEIQLEGYKFDEDLQKYDDRHAEMITISPHLKHAGPKEHLMWVRKTKETVSIPVIASLNAVKKETWLEYANLLQETGVDGIELNFYTAPKDFEKDASSIEEEQLTILKIIKESVTIPVSVKLSLFYSNPLHFISRLAKAGVDGFVLFNRFFQPDIDINKEENIFPFNLSNQIDNRLPLRFAGLLSGNINGDLCCSTGIFEAEDIIKMILAGANCVQVVSTLYKNKISHIQVMLKNLIAWMENKKYESLDDFRGKMSKKNIADPWVYTRAQYVKLLLNPEKIINNYPVI